MCYDEEGDMMKELGSKAFATQVDDDPPLPRTFEELLEEVDGFKRRLEKVEKRLAVVERGASPVNINTYYARSPL